MECFDSRNKTTSVIGPVLFVEPAGDTVLSTEYSISLKQSVHGLDF